MGPSDLAMAGLPGHFDVRFLVDLPDLVFLRITCWLGPYLLAKLTHLLYLEATFAPETSYG